MTDEPRPAASVDEPPGRAAETRRSRRGVVIAAVALLVVAAVVIGGVVPRLKAMAALRRETYERAVWTVSVTQPRQGTPQQEIVLPGNMQAFTDAPIYARTNGYLKRWYVEIGSSVKAGQLLAEIEAPEVDQQLQQARADLNTARANSHLADVTASRYKGLLSTNSVSKQAVDNAVGDFEAKQAIVLSAEHNVKRLEELQSFQRIYAPFDGVLTARNVDVGALIDAGSGAPAREMFHMAATGRLRVYINVPQQYSPAARPDLVAELTLPEFPGRRFHGTLVRTANAIDVASRTLLVEVDVDNPTGELLPGAYAEVHLVLPSDTPSFVLPVNTLIFRSQGLQVAKVEDGSRAVLVPITLGRDFGNEVEVSTGLTGGERIIVNPPDSLISGETVRIAEAAGEAGAPHP